MFIYIELYHAALRILIVFNYMVVQTTCFSINYDKTQNIFIFFRITHYYGVKI